MKKYGKYLIAAVAGLVFFAACDNYEADDHKFGNAVYLDVAETNEVQLTTFGNNKPTYDCALQAELTYPAGQDVAVTLTVDPSLVGRTTPATVRSGRCSMPNTMSCRPRVSRSPREKQPRMS